MTRFRTILIMVAAAATLSLGAAMPAFAAPKDRSCLTDQQTRAAIGAGQIQTWPKIRKLGGIPPDYYETSDTPVCQRNGLYYYVVNMASPKGENFKIVLNAVDGTAEVL